MKLKTKEVSKQYMNIMDMLIKLGYVQWFPTTRLTARAVELCTDDTDGRSIWRRLEDEMQSTPDILMWRLKTHFVKKCIEYRDSSALWDKVLSHLRTKCVSTSTPTDILLALYRTYKEVKDEN